MTHGILEFDLKCAANQNTHHHGALFLSLHILDLFDISYPVQSVRNYLCVKLLLAEFFSSLLPYKLDAIPWIFFPSRLMGLRKCGIVLKIEFIRCKHATQCKRNSSAVVKGQFGYFSLFIHGISYTK